MPRVPLIGQQRVQEQLAPTRQQTATPSAEAFGGGQSQAQVGQAIQGTIGQLGGTVARIEAEEKKRADDIQIMSAVRKTTEFEMRALRDPVTGALNTKGKDAFGATDSTLASFDEELNSIRGDLSNEEQRFAFDRASQNIRLSMQRKLLSHESNQTQVYDREETNALVQTEQNAASLNFDFPDRIVESITRQRQAITESAERNGVPDESRDLLIANSTSETHRGVISRLLAENRDNDARSYFEANKDQMVPQHLNRLQQQFNQKVARVSKLRKKNPWEYMEKVGYLTPQNGFNSIDFNNPDSVLERVGFITQAQKVHGYPDGRISFLNPNEAESIVRGLSNSSVQETANFYRTINDNAPIEVRKKLSAEVFKADPTVGISMDISADDLESAQRIIAGRKLFFKTGQKGLGTGSSPILKPSSKEVLDTFDSIVGNAIEDAALREQLRETAFYHYAKGEFDKNSFTDVLDTGAYEESLQKIMGPVFEINDSAVMSFRDINGDFVEEDEFEDAEANFTDELFLETQGDIPKTRKGESVNLRKSRGRLDFKAVSDARYVISREGEILLDKNSEPFIVDMRKIIEFRRKQKEEQGDQASLPTLPSL